MRLIISRWTSKKTHLPNCMSVNCLLVFKTYFSFLTILFLKLIHFHSNSDALPPNITDLASFSLMMVYVFPASLPILLATWSSDRIQSVVLQCG